MANWERIRQEWVMGSDDITLRLLANRYNVKVGTICARAATGKWSTLRQEYRDEIAERVRFKAIGKSSELYLHIMSLYEERIQEYGTLVDEVMSEFFGRDDGGKLYVKLEVKSVDDLLRLILAYQKLLRLYLLVLKQSQGSTLAIDLVEGHYPSEFNEELRYRIQTRDEYKCVECGRTDGLVVHHIDYDKTNSDRDNLISLCTSCHGKTIHDTSRRIDWMAYYTLKVKEINSKNVPRSD